MGAHRRLRMLPGLCIRRILFGHEPSNATRSLFGGTCRIAAHARVHGRSLHWRAPRARRGRASPVAQRHACRVRGVHERWSRHFGRAWHHRGRSCRRRPAYWRSYGAHAYGLGQNARRKPAAPRRHRNFRRDRHCRGMLLRAVVCARGNRFGASVRAAIRGRGVHGNRPTRAKRRHVGNDAPNPH